MILKKFRHLGVLGIVFAFIACALVIPQAMAENLTNSVTKKTSTDVKKIIKSEYKNTGDAVAPMMQDQAVTLSSRLLKELPARRADALRIEPVQTRLPSVSGKRDYSRSKAVERLAADIDAPDPAGGVVLTDLKNNICEAYHDDAHAVYVELWRSFPVFNGEMTSIAMDHANKQTVYVGTRNAGVFKTTDGAQSWQPAREGLTFYPIRSLAIDPQNPNTIYAGTDNNGIWKSTDGANSWFKSGNGLDEVLIVFNIVIDPQDTDTIYAGLAGGIGLGIGNIYKSEDGGGTWEMKDEGIPRYSGGSHTNGIISLAIDPDNPSLLYAGTNNDYGAFKSSDGGETWMAINDCLPGSEGSRPSIGALAINPYNSNRLSGIIEGLADGGYYIFDDDNGWKKISQTYELTSGSHLYFHPTNPSVIYSSGGLSGSFMISTDAGITWEQSLGHPDSGRIADIAFHPSSPNTIYAASDIGLSVPKGGVYKSDNQGESWFFASHGITATAILSVAIDPQNPDYIYGGTGSGRVFRTSDGGKTWSMGYYYINPHQVSYSLGFEVYDIAVHPLNSQNIYVASGNFYKSTDHGETFNKIEEVEDARCIAMAPGTSNPIYVGGSFGHGIYVSSDSGLTWTQRNDGLPIFGDYICPILSLAIDPNDTSIVWAGTQYGGGIVKSSDCGEHWEVKGLTDENFVDAIAVTPDNSNTILVGAGFWDGKIYKSVDGGETWSEKLSEIGFVQDIEFDPSNSKRIYVATEGNGVLRSTDGGETWHDFSEGIFYPVVYSLAITQDQSPLLIAGSYGSGLYWSHRSTPKGDINGDRSIDLADAILALQVMTGMTPSGIVSNYALSGADVNGDGKIGKEEVIYILQKVCGVR